jgi:hypothetical protein
MINKTIASDIKDLADEEGNGYKNWYCGIASDPEKRLFKDHTVPRENNRWWIYYDSPLTEQDARDTEKFLLSLGFKGGEGGGDHTTRYIYAYRIIDSTVE